MEAQRRAFLERIEADLTARSDRFEGTDRAPRNQTNKRYRRIARNVGAVAAVLAGGVIPLAVGANSANAASPGQGGSAQEVVIASCVQPDPVAFSHNKMCGAGLQRFIYLHNYSPNGGLIRCYVFDHISMACGFPHYAGRKEACKRVA